MTKCKQSGHFRKYHNTLCLSPQILHKHCFCFSQVHGNSQEKMKTMLMQNLRRQTKSIMVFSTVAYCFYYHTDNYSNRAVFKWLSKVITWLRLLRLVIGLKESRQFFNQREAKPKPIAPCTRDFPALRASYRWLLGIVIGSLRCLFPLWLVGVVALVLVFRQSFENRSIWC